MSEREPLRVGLLVGREWSFPPAFMEELVRRDAGVVAEYVRIGGTRMDEPNPYAVIVDRISHEVPYYRSYLKDAVLSGTYVVNNPFMWTADDKFFGASLVTRLGVVSPKTVVLPNRDYVAGIVHDESLRNLAFPVPWEDHLEYLGGFPVVLKDAHGGGWKNVSIAHDWDELWTAYNTSGLLTMVLQEFIRFDDYLRCMCIAQRDILVRRYNVDDRRYYPALDLGTELYERVVADSLAIVRAFGYDMNTAEWAVRDGVPYAIDFMNPAPDMDVNMTGEDYHRWCVERMADMCIELATAKRHADDPMYWRHLLPGNPEVAVVPDGTDARPAAPPPATPHAGATQGVPA